MWAITLPTRIKKALKSIRFKFIVAYLLIIIVSFGALGVAAVQLVGEHLYTLKGENGIKLLRSVKDDAESFLSRFDMDGLYLLCVKTDKDISARIFIADANMNVICDSHSKLNGRRLDIKGLLATQTDSGSFKTLKASDYPNIAPDSSLTRLSVSALPLADGFTIWGVYGADDVARQLNSIFGKLIFALAGVLALIVLLGFMITRSYTRPVKELSGAIAQLSAGDFSVRVKEEGNNELSDLSRAFNDMTGRMEMLDRSRNQFVSNASHELKTPLTTIKIMVQTLLYQEVYDADMSKEFLTDVDKEVDRLSAVVSDLLTLVGMDSGESKLKTEELSLTDMLKEDVKRLSPLARERGVELELSAGQQLDVVGDRIKLDQVFYNLIDNAIKYTPRGEGVRVELTRQNKNAVVRVRDNGIGIPEADIKHIFDRFYRVDKARSRETGGTGLGLSIVKQIILAHGGAINVASKVDEGSVFTVTLPLGGKSAGRQSA